MQLQDVVQSWILPKHIVLAITQAILAHFSSNRAQNVRIFRVYYVSNRSRAQPVAIGLKRSGCVISKAGSRNQKIGPKRSCSVRLVGCMNRTLKHYR